VITTAKFQLVIDCLDPEPLARFWVAALGYEFEPPVMLCESDLHLPRKGWGRIVLAASASRAGHRLD
jgi:Glyoxalase-like domain